MLNIPTDMDTWNPSDVTAWHAALADDETVTDEEHAAAQKAVHVALLGDTTPEEVRPMTDQPAGLALRIEQVLRAAAHDCDGTCGLSEAECDAQNPIRASSLHHGVIASVDGYIQDIATVAAAAVQPELDQLRAELATARASLAAAGAEGYRLAANEACAMANELGRDADARVILRGLNRGASLSEQHAAAMYAQDEPNGCAGCGLPEREHARQWTDEAGWHPWRQPTDAQIKERMRARRAVRTASTS